jgi:hypothetical protein
MRGWLDSDTCFGLDGLWSYDLGARKKMPWYMDAYAVISVVGFQKFLLKNRRGDYMCLI